MQILKFKMQFSLSAGMEKIIPHLQPDMSIQEWESNYRCSVMVIQLIRNNYYYIVK